MAVQDCKKRKIPLLNRGGTGLKNTRSDFFNQGWCCGAGGGNGAGGAGDTDGAGGRGAAVVHLCGAAYRIQMTSF